MMKSDGKYSMMEKEISQMGIEKIRFLPETFFLSVVHRRRWIFDLEDPDVRDVALIVKRRGLSHKERGESPPHPPPQLLLITRVILRDMAASRSLFLLSVPESV